MGIGESEAIASTVEMPLDQAPTVRSPGAAAPVTLEAGPLAGTFIGPYVLLRELGRGGMGVVFRAFDTSLRRPVALKMILNPSFASRDDADRLEREAKATARLDHPGIVRIFDTGEHLGNPYFVLELVEGETLAAHLRRETLDARRAASIARDVALALDHAHERGVVHRDVKPPNIMIDERGLPRLMDFGMARNVHVTSLTETGTVLGTPAYMPPEQASGDTRTQDGRSDVYSLGAVLFRCLTGREPFVAPSFESLVKKILLDAPPSLRRIDSKIPVDLETITLRCLAKDPAHRYPTARALAEDLGRFLEGLPILARPTSALERARRWARRNRGTAAALALAALGLSLAAGLGVHRAVRSATEARRGEVRDRGRWLFELNKNYDAAIAEFSKGIEIAPEDARGFLDRGLVHERKGELDAALADYSHAVEIGPEDPQTWAMRGFLRRLRGERKQALADFTRSLELRPGHAGCWDYRGVIREELGDHPGALADFARALELEPRHARTLAHRAEARLRAGDVAGATADANLAVKIQPKLGLGWTVLARARLAAGEVAKAAEASTEATVHDPSSAEAWLVRADVSARAGESERASFYLEEARRHTRS